MNLFRLCLKSDLRVFGLVFTGIILVAVIYAARQPRWYQARSTVQFQSPMQTNEMFSGSQESERPNVMIAVMKSPAAMQKVFERLSAEERTAFLKSYGYSRTDSEGVFIKQLIQENQQVFFDPLERELIVQYEHPDRLLVARIANLFIDELIAYQARLRIDEAIRAVEGLKLREEQQQKVIDDLTEELSAYRKSPNNTEPIIEGLQKRQSDEQKILNTIIQSMRDTTMCCGMEPQSWRINKRAVPPNEDDSLMAPIVACLSWGFAFAVVGGLLAVGLLNAFARGRELTDNQREAA